MNNFLFELFVTAEAETRATYTALVSIRKRRPLSTNSGRGIYILSISKHTMNLALIDPFQLAQDSPDALTNDLSKYSIVHV